MKIASEYRKHAEECRALARRMDQGAQRERLLDIARTWDQLAEDRETKERKKKPAEGRVPD
jgi:hypothetical protein